MKPRDEFTSRLKETIDNKMLGIQPPAVNYEAISERARRHRRARPLTRFGWVVAAAAAAVVVGVFAPLGTYAQGFLNIFEPQQFVAVPITRGELSTLPKLSGLGTPSRSGPPTIGAVNSAAQASRLVGFAVQMPGWLPSSLQESPTMSVLQEGALSFTFNKPSLPASLHGSTLTLQVPPAFLAMYGGPSVKAVASGKATTSPTLMLAELKAPTLKSSGGSVQEIEKTLLSRPGVSPALKSEILSINNPASTLPIPVPEKGASSKYVQVQGVKALLVEHGRKSALIWQKNGDIFALYGSESGSTLTAIAKHLHA